MIKNILSEYCTGCGLCSSVKNVKHADNDAGFSAPIFNNNEQKDFCLDICPVNGKHLNNQDNTIWGIYKSVYSGYANDNEIRFKAASGGTTTAIASYLVESGLVDGVIQVGEDESNPFLTKNYVSTTKEDLISHCGSRYIVSSPLSNLQQILSLGGKYAIIGRPCDIVVVKNFLEVYPQYVENVYCTLAFFCAGAPSVNASKRLANKLSINPDEVTKIRYRGYGWPGKTTVFSKDKDNCMEYIDSWNHILGRDIRKICKFCTDGVGEAADISSGDLWNLKDGKPVFEESDGMNVVFSRTDRGEEIIQGAVKAGYVSLADYNNKLSELELVQPNHAARKKLLYPRVLGMRLMGKAVPNYDMKKLKVYCKDEPSLTIIKTTFGTVKRILNGKI